jgi:hypothetical protein
MDENQDHLSHECTYERSYKMQYYFLGIIITLEITEGAIKNGQSRETGNRTPGSNMTPVVYKDVLCV